MATRAIPQPELDEVQHPTLGTLKFPKDMGYDERNKIIQQMEASSSDTTPLSQQGAVRRFAERALGVPDRLFDHPGDYLNPFSKGYWDTAKKERSGELPSMVPQSGEQLAASQREIPGTQTLSDIRSGNYAGALGDVLPEAYAAASIAAPGLKGGMRSLGRAMETNAPAVGEWAAHPIRNAARAVGQGTTRAGGRLLQKMAGPAPTGPGVWAPDTSIERPIYGPPTEPEATRPGVWAPDTSIDRPVYGPQPEPPPQLSPAPYRMSGSQIQDATTVTPRRVIGPERQLPPASDTAPSQQFSPQPLATPEYFETGKTPSQGIPATKLSRQTPLLDDMRQWRLQQNAIDEMNVQEGTGQDAADARMAEYAKTPWDKAGAEAFRKSKLLDQMNQAQPAPEPAIEPESGTYSADPRTHEEMLQAVQDMRGGGQGKVAMQEDMGEQSAAPPRPARPGFGTAKVPIEERGSLLEDMGEEPQEMSESNDLIRGLQQMVAKKARGASSSQ